MGPLTYTILPNEDTATLKTAFKQVRKAAEEHGNGFAKFTEIMCDYDGHLREAYKETIGNDYQHRYRGCSFHFSQRLIENVNGAGMMGRYKDNVILRDTIQAAIGISYLREEDLQFVAQNLHTIFDSIEESDPRTFKFLKKFVDNYIQGYWLTAWDKSEVCFFGDTSISSSEHMNNNALESYNNELYNLLGRHAHPNPYYFVARIRSALAITQKMLSWVENGDFIEVKSRDAKKVAMKRQRLKVQYLERLKRCANEHDVRRARLRYMKASGGLSAKVAKGRGKKKKKIAPTGDQSGKRTGRPSYRRKKAPQEKKCRFCGKTLLSKSGCKNHEKICSSREGIENEMSCKHCRKIYKVMYYLIEHESKCGGKRQRKKPAGKKDQWNQLEARLKDTQLESDSELSESQSRDDHRDQRNTRYGDRGTKKPTGKKDHLIHKLQTRFESESGDDESFSSGSKAKKGQRSQLECHICTHKITKSDMTNNVTRCDCDCDNTDFVHIECQFTKICPFTT